MNLIEDLKWRGLIYQCTDDTALEELLANNKIRLYLGFDPTAESLHVGHMVGIFLLKRFQMAGHTPMPLVGGSTGMIGDPKPSGERTLNTPEVVAGYADKIKGQISPFLDFEGENGAILVNNLDWTGNMSVLEFLRDIGKHFNLNYMLSKDVVQSRLDEGISFTEFSYMTLQSMDFLKLYQNHDCVLQLGGSDQWGNITAGNELIRKNEPGSKVFGMTFPLVTKSDGTKFGKTEGGAVWLNPALTTPYEFYQFWLNVEDAKVIEYLKFYSFKSKEEIETLAGEVAAEPHKRAAQKALAEELTELVHGKEALEQALKISAALFSGDIKSLSVDEIRQGFKGVPTFETEEKEDYLLVDLLVDAKVSPSKRQAREDITNGAVSINGEKQQNVEHVITEDDKLGQEFTIIRRGKKKYMMIKYN